MKILITSVSGSYNSGDTAAEYMGDSIFHGLRSLLGPDVIDPLHKWHMYASAPKERLANLHGRGFTLFGLLDDIQIDRDGVVDKIRTKFYDYIIVTPHCTVCDEDRKYHLENKINELSQYYEPNKLILIDGSDKDSFIFNVRDKVTYFKRELVDTNDWAKPISFSIPKCKIVNDLPTKSKDFACVIPWHDDTYGFEHESDYYADYQKSFFGYTCKKGGWDCMRHYEILANASVPYFINLKNCPQKTMRSFPKWLASELDKFCGVCSNNNIRDRDFRSGYINHEVFDRVLYQDLQSSLLDYTKKQLTTESVALYLLDEMVKNG